MRARLLTATAALAFTAALVGCEPATDSTTAAPAAAAAAGQKQDKAAAKPAKSEPTMTAAQKNAVKSAESYLSHSDFSKSGLIDQLKYEDFSTKDATFAVENVEVDWMEQAVKSAESYMSHSSFSLSGLIDQLKYEGFTAAQAKHGATKAYK